jgi:hypothetical protein
LQYLATIQMSFFVLPLKIQKDVCGTFNKVLSMSQKQL